MASFSAPSQQHMASTSAMSPRHVSPNSTSPCHVNHTGTTTQKANNTRSWTDLFNQQRKMSKSYSLQEYAPNDRALKEEDLRDVGAYLIGYILGRFPGLKAVEEVRKSWNIQHTFDTHPSGWMIFTFQSVDDKNQVLQNGPYETYGAPWLLKTMPPFFNFSETAFTRVPTWVKLPGLPLNCWTKTGFSKIASGLGAPIAVDECTAQATRKAYARILVEVDVTKDLPKQVEVQRPDGQYFQQEVQYEWEPRFCSKCKRVGHTDANCWGRRGRSQSRPRQPHHNPSARSLAPGNHVSRGRRGRSRVKPQAVSTAPVTAGATHNIQQANKATAPQQDNGTTVMVTNSLRQGNVTTAHQGVAGSDVMPDSIRQANKAAMQQGVAETNATTRVSLSQGTEASAHQEVTGTVAMGNNDAMRQQIAGPSGTARPDNQDVAGFPPTDQGNMHGNNVLGIPMQQFAYTATEPGQPSVNSGDNAQGANVQDDMPQQTIRTEIKQSFYTDMISDDEIPKKKAKSKAKKKKKKVKGEASEPEAPYPDTN